MLNSPLKGRLASTEEVSLEYQLSSYFSDEKWWAMCEVDMGRPLPLAKADLTKPFVYCREHGVFSVTGGRHLAAMTLLLAFQHDEQSGLGVAQKLKLESPYGTADHWLKHTEGACFLSSVSKRVQAHSRLNLNRVERRQLEAVHGWVTYIGDYEKSAPQP